MSSKILFYLGIILVLFGLLYPIGLLEMAFVKYTLFVGIIVLGIGILLLPGKSEV